MRYTTISADSRGSVDGMAFADLFFFEEKFPAMFFSRAHSGFVICGEKNAVRESD